MDQVSTPGKFELGTAFVPSTPHRRSNSASSFTSHGHFPLESNASGLDKVLLQPTHAGGARRIEELADGLATLDINLQRLNKVHNSLTEFNESFSAFLHCIKMNAWCVEFSEAPNTEAFTQERDDDPEENQNNEDLEDEAEQDQADESNFDYSDMTLMTVIDDSGENRHFGGSRPGAGGPAGVRNYAGGFYTSNTGGIRQETGSTARPTARTTAVGGRPGARFRPEQTSTSVPRNPRTTTTTPAASRGGRVSPASSGSGKSRIPQPATRPRPATTTTRTTAKPTWR
ncbi:Dam1p [Sugiyamaella lignohabitans]|uniref:DASH complex subunit DAM1 n=1 Tax=Sugiyamaella lignohabitans TaxID=796027 RepID=A0A167D625_9ASCO|nr:Dam1p [Sugiyamaella lignohabitans]ANB12526.1 Dam1p [Sugiyamaella lignohabitans]